MGSGKVSGGRARGRHWVGVGAGEVVARRPLPQLERPLASIMHTTACCVLLDVFFFESYVEPWLPSPNPTYQPTNPPQCPSHWGVSLSTVGIPPARPARRHASLILPIRKRACGRA